MLDCRGRGLLAALATVVGGTLDAADAARGGIDKTGDTGRLASPRQRDRAEMVVIICRTLVQSTEGVIEPLLQEPRPEGSPQPFLKCRAPSATDRSRDEAGKSPPPGPERDAGPTPVSCAAPTPHPALRCHCASCAASRGKCPARLRSRSTADRCSPAEPPLPA